MKLLQNLFPAAVARASCPCSITGPSASQGVLQVPLVKTARLIVLCLPAVFLSIAGLLTACSPAKTKTAAEEKAGDSLRILIPLIL